MEGIAKYKALIGLAQADGEFDMHEKLFIGYLAEKQGISLKELKKELASGGKMGDLIEELTYNEKIEILTYLVKLMKADGKVVLSEIKYCEKMARAFGFEDKAIGFLSGSLNENPRIEPNFGMIRNGIKKYQLEKDALEMSD